MATKNIAISEEAYQRLKSLRRPGESFTDVVNRMTRNTGILELAGVLSNREADKLTEESTKLRRQSTRRSEVMRRGIRAS